MAKAVFAFCHLHRPKGRCKNILCLLFTTDFSDCHRFF